MRALPEKPRTHPDPVRFEELGHIVKFGPRVTTEEAPCLWATRRVLYGILPVPEVYGWRVNGHEVSIYLELIHGKTLMES